MAIEKGKLIIDGGEGEIYETQDNPNLLMKIYKETDLTGAPIVTPELHSKLRYMRDNPPEALVSKGVVAWPAELINDDGGNLLGFIMPRMDFDEHIQRTYSYRHPTLEADEYKRFPSVESRIKIAMNLCSALNELHIKGYVFGDLNHHNVGVNYKTGQIYYMDCDSLHITTAIGDVFRTSVIMSGYLAPEIIRHCNNERSKGREYNLDKVSLPTFTKESDLFCLAIHIFKLLMNGVSPFLGVKADAIGSTASPFVGNDAIERNAYVFREGNKPSAVFCLPPESLPFEVFTLFNRAFLDGARVSYLRPSAADWYNALNRYLTYGLVQCQREPKHQYYNQLQACPYCAADDRHRAEQEGVPVQSFVCESASLPVLPIQQPYSQQQSSQPSVQQPPVQRQTYQQPPTQQPPVQQPPAQQQRSQKQAAHKRPSRTAGGTGVSGSDIFTRIKNGETRYLQFGRDLWLWRVLDKQSDKVLLLTENVIELRQYNYKSKGITWESCSLREHLNTFFLQGFSWKEKSAIQLSWVRNSANLWCGAPGGYDTNDHVFLLSLAEADYYFGNSGNYAKKIISGNWTFSNNYDNERAAGEPWWLRSPGEDKRNAAYVAKSGRVEVSGYPVNSSDIGVRPALWLNLV